MTNESAVMPIATMNPATPARVSVNPICRPRMTSTAYTRMPDSSRLAIITKPSAR